MALLGKLLLLPLAPITGVIWLAEQLERIAEQEYYSEDGIQAELLEWQGALDRGDIGVDEYDAIEDALLARLDEARRFGEEARRS